MKNDVIDKILLQLISKTNNGIIEWKLYRPYDNISIREIEFNYSENNNQFTIGLKDNKISSQKFVIRSEKLKNGSEIHYNTDYPNIDVLRNILYAKYKVEADDMLNGTYLDNTPIYNDILKDIKPLKEIRKEKLNDIINEIDNNNDDKEEEEPRTLFRKFMDKLF